MRKVPIFIIFVVAIFFAYILGFSVAYNSLPAEQKVVGVANKTNPKLTQNVDFDIFWDAWRKVETKYVDKEKIDRQKMVYGAIEGMVRSLGDPYSGFFDPESAKIFREDNLKGSFSGIGAEIGFRKGLLTIISPLPNSPAQKAGIKAGDVIVKINGESTVDITLEQAVMKIRGKKGTKVTLTISREGSEELIDVDITRDIIEIPTIDSKIEDNNIGYIKIYRFSGNVFDLFVKSVKDLKRQGAESFIIDLRNNPGGLLGSVINITSTILPKGDVILIEKFGDERKERVYRSKGYNLLDLNTIPIVVLVNEGSASASEILAGALKGKKNVKIIGEKTFGKGSVQELVDLKDGKSALKITIAKWLTPSGQSINEKGIEPDIVIKQKEDSKDDIQLKRAIEIIKRKIDINFLILF